MPMRPARTARIVVSRSKTCRRSLLFAAAARCCGSGYRAGVGAALLLLLLPTGCTQPATVEPLPTLRDVYSDRAEATKEALTEAIPAALFYGQLDLQILYVPLEADLELAWRLVDEAAVPHLARTVWHGNGLRVGMLSRPRINDFMQALPSPMGQHRRSAAITEEPLALLESRPLRGTVVVDTTMPPFVAEEVAVNRGSLRLLLEPVLSGGLLAARLTPENYRPGYTAMLRTIHPDRTGHRLFSELSLLLHPQGQEMIVIGLQWPEVEEEISLSPSPGPVAALDAAPFIPASSQETTSQAAAPQVAAPEATASTLEEELHFPHSLQLPPHLGRALLVNRIQGHRVQALLIFRLGRVS